LEEVHGKPLQPDFQNGAELDAAYANVFRESGTDVERLGFTESVEQLRDRAISAELALALDDWTGMRRRRRPTSEWKKLLDLARVIDPDPWRNRLRTAWENNDRPGLERLAESAAVDRLPPVSLLLLGNSLCELGSLAAGMKLLERAQQQYPDDVWLNDALGDCNAWRLKPARWDAALRFYSAALAVRPDNYRLHAVVGSIQQSRGAYDSAVVAFSRAIGQEPNAAEAWRGRGMCYLELGQWTRAREDLGRADRLITESGAVVWRNHSAAFFGAPKAVNGRPLEAIRLDDFYGSGSIGANWSDAVGALTTASQHYPSRIGLPCRLAWLLVMCPDESFRDPSRAVVLAEKAAGLLPQDYSAQLVLGASRIRSGNPRAGVDALDKAVAIPTSGESRAWYFLALAHHALGDKDKALDCYTQAVRWQQNNKPNEEELIRLRGEVEKSLRPEKKDKD
jgi:tetratricopeptide (TPR) repeat protein